MLKHMAYNLHLHMDILNLNRFSKPIYLHPIARFKKKKNLKAVES